MYQQPFPRVLAEVLRTTLSFVEHYGSAIENPTNLRELKRALHAAITELESTTRPKIVVLEVSGSARLGKFA